MKDGLAVTTTEKNFLLQAVSEQLRLDEREFTNHRQETIYFGKQWGSCTVTLGDTKVLAGVSCDIQQPKPSKPTEGLLYVHVEVDNSAGTMFDANRQNDISIQVNRLLEKCLKESKCIDLESLCIVADEKVWNIRIDLKILNYDGNLAGCCSIAALAALSHFKRPDVSATGDQVIIHSSSEKDPIPMTIHHYPVIISYAIFNHQSSSHIVIDPTALEERVADSLLLLSVNSYMEICGMHMEGAPIQSKSVILKCTKDAAKLAVELVNRIKDAVKSDAEKRAKPGYSGMVDFINVDHILTKMKNAMTIHMDRPKDWRDDIPDCAWAPKVEAIPGGMEVGESEEDDNLADEDLKDSKYHIKRVDECTAELSSMPETKGSEDDDSSDSDDVTVENPTKPEEIQLSGDSDCDEDEIMILKPSDL